MNVLLLSVSSSVSKGGIATWTAHYLEGCDEMGIRCDLVNTVAIGNIAVQSTGKRNVFDELRRIIGIHRQLTKRFRHGRYDVAHLNTSVGVFGILRDYGFAKRIVKRGIPLVLHFHCDIPSWVRRPIVRRYLEKMLKLSTVNLVLCENSARYLQKEYGVHSYKMPNFVEGTMVLDKKEIRDKLETLCFVGRISRAKGARELYELARSFPHLQFNLVGELGRDMVDKTPPENVHFMGVLPRNEVIAALDSADAFVFPTYSEGFSIALAEAMARGLPCVTTNVGANLDMLEQGGGVVVRPRDVESLKAGIEVITDVHTRRKMSEWNLKKIREHYTSETVMRLLLDCYHIANADGGN